MQQYALPLTMFLKLCCLGECTGITYVDSTPIRVCKNKRIKRNKVFQNIATVGKSTMGFFFGFKQHLIVNEKGDLLNFQITQANTDDREPLKTPKFTEKISGKIRQLQIYICSISSTLFDNDIHLFTTIKRKMTNSLMTLADKILLRKRSVIETINDELKNICQVEHSRHRSFENFITNLISGLIAYCFFPKKPAIKVQHSDSDQLVLF
jgi:hypothetical protein